MIRSSMSTGWRSINIVMPDNRKCCDKVVNCYNDRRQPADRISTDRIDIAVKTIQNISITILINLHPVGIDDLIKNIRLNIIIDIDTQFCRNTSNHISNRKTKKCTSKCDQDHDPQLTHLISCDDIDHIFTCHTSKQREYGKKVREMSSEMMTFEVETFYNFDTIKSFGISSLYGKKMRNWQEKFKDISLKYNMFTIKTNIVMSIIGMVVQYAAFGYCLFRLWTRDISYGTMTLFLQQRSNLNGAFNNLVSIIPNFLNSSISAHRIRELAQLKKEVHIP